MATIQRIAPCLWFDTQAEDAARYYAAIFPNSRINQVARYPDEGKQITGKAAGSVMTVEFELDGQPFTALNGGPHFKFNEAVSLQVNCHTQQEIDYYWEKLSAGGDPNAQQCGWLKDKFGLSWQIVPTMMRELFADHESAGARRTMAAMLKMRKLDIAEAQSAYNGD
jgi:predicted 3-demethylubiquinone-9 3-methyltransferase (glyoxalase superfamily)